MIRHFNKIAVLCLILGITGCTKEPTLYTFRECIPNELEKNTDNAIKSLTLDDCMKYCKPIAGNSEDIAKLTLSEKKLIISNPRNEKEEPMILKNCIFQNDKNWECGNEVVDKKLHTINSITVKKYNDFATLQVKSLKAEYGIKSGTESLICLIPIK